MTVAIAILGSGKGSNCRAILQNIQEGKLSAEAKLVISDVLDAPILDIACEFGVPNAYLSPGRLRTRLEPAAEAELVEMLRDAKVELVVLAQASMARLADKLPPDLGVQVLTSPTLAVEHLRQLLGR